MILHRRRNVTQDISPLSRLRCTPVSRTPTDKFIFYVTALRKINLHYVISSVIARHKNTIKNSLLDNFVGEKLNIDEFLAIEFHTERKNRVAQFDSRFIAYVHERDSLITRSTFQVAHFRDNATTKRYFIG